jgi:rhodanese-related sulfurtransferase
MKSFFFFLLPFCSVLILSSCGSSALQPQESRTHSNLVHEISILRLDSLRTLYPTALLIDVRSDEEWATGHLSQSSFISFDWDHRLDSLKRLPTDRPVLVYCEAGGRSGVIVEELRILGHPHIIDLIGGMEAWQQEGRDVSFEKAIPLPH